ncbi:MAG: sterol desaturase family protein [Ferruginibacter sp.]
MYYSWLVPILGFIMLLGYSLIYFVEWKHPRYKLVLSTHSTKQWLDGCLNILTSIFMGWLFASYLFIVSHHLTGLFSWLTQNAWLQGLYSFIFLDFIIYAWHRINHLFPSLWKFHAFHHKEKELNVFSTFHFHPKEIIISTCWRLVLLPLIGIAPAALLIYNTVFFTIILFHHSNIKIPYKWDKLLGNIIVTPGLHHVHHSVKMIESNSNYGSVFSFWDKIFGSVTFYRQQSIKFGLEEK